MIHLFMGPMGASKSYEGVKYAILPALKEGRRVISNIRGLDHEKIAAHLKMPVSDIIENLIVIGETDEDTTIGPRFAPSRDEFWGNEDNTGFIKWGDVLVLDECWAWLRDRKLITEPALNYMRKHRHYIGGSGNWSCEIYLITQTEKDVAPSIRDVVERVVKLESLRATGSRAWYMRTEMQGLRDTQPTTSRHKRDTAIYPLYQSHKVEGASEASVDNRNVWWRQREAALIAVLVVGLAASIPFYILPTLKHWGMVKDSAVVGGGSAPINPQSPQTAAGIGGTGLGAGVPLVGPQVGQIPPTGLAAGVAPPPNQIGPETQTPISAPVLNTTLPNSWSTVTPPARASSGSYSAPVRSSSFSRTQNGQEQAPQTGALAPISEKPASFVQVMPLRGDPSAVEAVTKAFCEINACRVVVRPETSQIILVGTNAEIAGLINLIQQLGERAPGQMVNALIIELEDNAREAFGFALNGPNGIVGSTAIDAGGVTARLPLGSFTATLQALQSNGSARVLTAPSVMTWPGEKAQVTAGLQVPTLSSVTTSENGRATQNIEYRQSGVILNLEQVTSGDRPVFRVNLEVSNFSETETGVAQSPTKSNRTLSTVAELLSGEVLVLGGMDRETQTTTRDRVPLIGIPLAKTERTIRTRVFVALLAGPAGQGASGRANAPQEPEVRP